MGSEQLKTAQFNQMDQDQAYGSGYLGVLGSGSMWIRSDLG